MFLVDHQELDEPAMVCPFARAAGADPQCMGKQCALWYRSTDGDHSGCSIYVTASYSSGISYHVRQMAESRGYRRE